MCALGVNDTRSDEEAGIEAEYCVEADATALGSDDTDRAVVCEPVEDVDASKLELRTTDPDASELNDLVVLWDGETSVLEDVDAGVDTETSEDADTEEKTDNDWRGEYEAVEHWVTHAEGVLLGKDVPVSTLDAAGESGGRGASQV